MDYWKSRLEGFSGTVVIANTYGQEEGIPFCGLSAIYSENHFRQFAPRSGDSVVILDVPID